MKDYKIAKSKVKKKVKAYKIIVWSTLGFSVLIIAMLCYEIISKL